MNIIYASWRNSTKKQYATYINRWEIFCLGRNCDPFRAPVGEVLLFLTELYKSGLEYSDINTARSTISAVVQTVGDKLIGAHSKVIRFLKGVFELRTSLPRYKQTWNISVVLKIFREQVKNSELSLKLLTTKLCALLLLDSAQRVQTIHLIRFRCIQFHDEECTIHIMDKLKHTRPGYHHTALQRPKYMADEKLRVVNCLKEYLKEQLP